MAAVSGVAIHRRDPFIVPRNSCVPGNLMRCLCSCRSSSSRRSAHPVQRGFTLLEVMVVVVIMGMIVGLVSVLVEPDDRSLLNVEAQRLAQLLDLAAAEARVSGVAIAWTADADAYQFQQLTEELGWIAIRNNDSLRSRQLPQGITISSLLIENSSTAEAMRVEFPAYGQTTAFTVELHNGSARNQVVVSPIGIVTVVLPTEDADDDS